MRIDQRREFVASTEPIAVLVGAPRGGSTRAGAASLAKAKGILAVVAEDSDALAYTIVPALKAEGVDILSPLWEVEWQDRRKGRPLSASLKQSGLRIFFHSAMANPNRGAAYDHVWLDGKINDGWSSEMMMRTVSRKGSFRWTCSVHPGSAIPDVLLQLLTAGRGVYFTDMHETVASQAKPFLKALGYDTSSALACLEACGVTVGAAGNFVVDFYSAAA